MPKISAIYFLYLNKILQYIGQSRDVYSRIRSHRKIKYDYYSLVPCRGKELLKKEASFIYEYDPLLCKKPKYPFEKMVRGASFPLDGLGESRVVSAAYSWAKRRKNGARFSVQTIGGKKHLFRMI